ncbi:hypothetical protein ANO11243_070060 [Dothideomycetidae sp. 11243]|nr:hypothetical protein ANO11243_070060 [fungal sp. No.11243]
MVNQDEQKMSMAAACDDPAFELGGSIDLSDRETEQRIVRKIDWHILPWICSCYLINYLDRTNLGNARTLNNDIPADNLVQQLGLTGIRYNISIAVFFVPYVCMEFPSNILLNYFSPSIWIGRIMITWGIVTLCTAAVRSYGGLLAVRFCLGIAEAGFFPGVVYYLCLWYKPNERATRMAIFAGSIAVAGAFSGLLATGISFLNRKGNLSGWQWLFTLEGIPAVLIGLAVLFFMPNYPADAKFLTAEERTFAAARLGPYAPGKHDKHWDGKVARETLADPLFWVFAIQCESRDLYSRITAADMSDFLMTNSLNAFGYFAPTIIATLGFKGYTGQLLTVPPNVFALLVILGVCIHSDRSKERTRHVIAALAFVSVGYLLLAVVRNWIARYVAVFLIACTNAAVLPFLAHRTSTVKGLTATALATGGIIALANCGGITAPFLFPSTDGPEYPMGSWTIFAFLVASVGSTIYLGWKLGTGSEYKDVDDIAADDTAANTK